MLQVYYTWLFLEDASTEPFSWPVGLLLSTGFNVYTCIYIYIYIYIYILGSLTQVCIVYVVMKVASFQSINGCEESWL